MRITTRHASVMALSLCVWLGVPMRASDTDGQAYWPQWRGPFATGASDRADPPVEWSETKNVKWKVEIPGPRIGVAGRVGRPHLRADCGSRGRGSGRRPRRLSAASNRAACITTSCWRSTGRAARRCGSRPRERHAARGRASGQRDLGVELRGHRRRARHRLVRVARASTPTT